MSDSRFPHIHIFNPVSGEILPTCVEINGVRIPARRIQYDAEVGEIPVITIEMVGTVDIDIDNGDVFLGGKYKSGRDNTTGPDELPWETPR